ncbi:uncharacterized protein LOC107627522 [Arachis ipaensis]|uniref:uncharacterized protein LOC107627522 n=1 Tax=Arachis ipaensis TaxID=130454 RepID=UPI0007AEF595|nr:uncharacterized protein LOC107627522 [Arachis ipaensis]XP_025636163.1 uncharacterized protein LOC112730285 [Arachis hypogaea]
MKIWLKTGLLGPSSRIRSYLYDEDEEIITILQAQNKATAQKKSKQNRKRKKEGVIPKTGLRGQSCSRTDRGLVSLEWVEKFPKMRFKGGPRGLSDHCPLLMEDSRMRRGEIHFTKKLKALTVPLSRWYKENFSDNELRIQKLEDEIKKVDELEEEAAELEKLSSIEEIKDAVWDCELSKAPDCDGYNMNFIKKYWGDIGSEFTTTVMDFFQSAELPRDSNVTWIALAPKFIRAKEIKDLWLISMVDCVYKVLSKVLVQRIRSVMSGLVGETQSAFVMGRKIHDEALIAYETMQWLKTKKKSSTIIKLDFQKSYDRMKWSSVDTVL